MDRERVRGRGRPSGGTVHTVDSDAERAREERTMSDTDEYVERVRERVTGIGFESFDGLPSDSRFDEAYAQRVKSVTIGASLYKFITIDDSGALSRDAVRDVADEFRSILVDVAPGENVLGYVVLPAAGIDADVRQYITDEYEPIAEMTAVFPIGVDLSASETITAPVPQTQLHALYSAQKADAEMYFAPK